MASGTTNSSTHSAATWPPVQALKVEKTSEASLTPKDTEASKCDTKKTTERARDPTTWEPKPGMRKCTAYLSGCTEEHADRGVLDGK